MESGADETYRHTCMWSFGAARLETLAGSLSLTNGAPRPGCHDPTLHALIAQEKSR